MQNRLPVVCGVDIQVRFQVNSGYSKPPAPRVGGSMMTKQSCRRCARVDVFGGWFKTRAWRSSNRKQLPRETADQKPCSNLWSRGKMGEDHAFEGTKYSLKVILAAKTWLKAFGHASIRSHVLWGTQSYLAGHPSVVGLQRAISIQQISCSLRKRNVGTTHVMRSERPQSCRFEAFAVTCGRSKRGGSIFDGDGDDISTTRRVSINKSEQVDIRKG